MITVNDVSLNFSGQTLFKHVDLKFTPGNCYGIIGANGAGKSTFLKILSGELEPTSGEVSILPKTRMSVLKQDQNSPLEVEEQVVIIYAVINNFLKDIAVDKIKQYQADLLDHIKSTCPDILTSIKTEKVMKPEIEEQLKKVLADFAKGYAA
mgnify:CR=1 FL=1